MSEPSNNLNQLIQSTQQDAQAQQRKMEALASQPAPKPRGKQILTAVLMAVFAVVLVVQFPRFSEPFTWPDPANNPSAAEADLVEVISLIEIYRLSQGKYPAVLSQLTLPAGLAGLLAESPLTYRPSETGYTLAWTLPHWQANYDSVSEKISVTPLGKR